MVNATRQPEEPHIGWIECGSTIVLAERSALCLKKTNLASWAKVKERPLETLPLAGKPRLYCARSYTIPRKD